MCTINDCEDVFCDAIDAAPDENFENSVTELEAIIAAEHVTFKDLAKAVVRWLVQKTTE